MAQVNDKLRIRISSYSLFPPQHIGLRHRDDNRSDPTLSFIVSAEKAF